MSSEMWKVPEMVWVNIGPQKWQSAQRFYYIEGDNPDCPQSYTPYFYGCNKDGCRVNFAWLTCRTFEEASLVCEKHRRSLAKAIGFVRVEEVPDAK